MDASSASLTAACFNGLSIPCGLTPVQFEVICNIICNLICNGNVVIITMSSYNLDLNI